MLIYFSWNFVSLLVLLCQGFLFETDSDDGNDAVLAFGILSVLIIIMCLTVTVVMAIFTTLRPHQSETILIPRVVIQRLPQVLLLEMFFINTLAEIDERGELKIPVRKFEKFMTVKEFENLQCFIQSREDGNELKQVSLIGKVLVQGAGESEDTLSATMRARDTMFHEFKEYTLKSAAL
jgi:hypothetical protein